MSHQDRRDPLPEWYQFQDGRVLTALTLRDSQPKMSVRFLRSYDVVVDPTPARIDWCLDRGWSVPSSWCVKDQRLERLNPSANTPELAAAPLVDPFDNPALDRIVDEARQSLADAIDVEADRLDRASPDAPGEP